MNVTRRIPWSRKVTFIVAGPIIWFLLMAGIFALITGGILTGAIEITGAMAIFILVINNRTSSFLKGRSIPLPVFIFFLLYVVMIGLLQLSILTSTDIYFLGEIDPPSIVSLISSIGYLLILIIVVWQSIQIIRTSS